MRIFGNSATWFNTIIISLSSLCVVGCKPASKVEVVEDTRIKNPVTFIQKQKVVEINYAGKFESLLTKKAYSELHAWEKQYKSSYERSKNKFKPSFDSATVWFVTPDQVKISDIDKSGKYVIHFDGEGLDNFDYIIPYDPVDTSLLGKKTALIYKCKFSYDEDAILDLMDRHSCEDAIILDEHQHEEIKKLIGSQSSRYSLLVDSSEN